jgi:hypothetical protein
MKHRRSLCFAAVLVTSVLLALQGKGAEVAGGPRPSIGIGKGEEDGHTHLSFEGSYPEGAKIVQVSARLIVDEAPPKGLNFFALEVDFPNSTWIHGGPQLLGEDGGKASQAANWGGLVDRGGGNDDYDLVDWEKDVLLIQCGVNQPNTVPWPWQLHREYVLTVSRGKRVRLPAGMVTMDDETVRAPARTMWEWHFSIRPAKPSRGDRPFESLCYNSADSIAEFYLWNESGYGSDSDEQHTRWSLPLFRLEGSSEEHVATEWQRF